MFFPLDLFFEFFQTEEKVLWHPESPGVKVQIERNPLGDFFKPNDFATISEVLKSYDGKD